jgi:hypothetical protein
MTTGSEPALRRILLLVVAIGTVGLLAELFLLDHFEEWTQWLPSVVLVLCLGSCALVALRPQSVTVRVFRWIMVATIATGVVGVWLHYDGNRAFELEMDGAMNGWLLIWHSLRGATPALAPGAMVQLGLIGLLFAWRHPALIDDNHNREE